MIITESIEISDDILSNGGFADVRCGTYMGQLVVVKTMRVAAQDDFLKIRKVSINDTFPLFETQPQLFRSSDFARKSFSGIPYPIRMS